jgi:hypothetical protein
MTSGATTTVHPSLQDFLTLPGISGFAIIDQQEPAYFCELVDCLPRSTQSLLADNLLQVFETIPSEFNQMSLRWESYHTLIDRLNADSLLLVIAQRSREDAQYRSVLPAFVQLLQSQRPLILDQLQILYGQPETESHPSSSESPRQNSTPAATTNSVPRQFITPPVDAKDLLSMVNTLDLQSTDEIDIQDLQSTAQEPPTLGKMLAVINQVIDLGVQYLGKSIVINHLSQLRPKDEWFAGITVQSTNHLRVMLTTTEALDRPLNLEQYNGFQEWTEQLIQTIRRVIRNFRELVNQHLSNPDKVLLMPESG